MAAPEFERWLDQAFPETDEEREGRMVVIDQQVEAADGRKLAATLFVPPDGEVVGTVNVFPGTAIPRGYYDAFARHLASRGLVTLSIDYRGIGGSRTGPLRKLDATKIDWAEQDMAGALDYMVAYAPRVPHYVVGHSVGGQLLALLPNRNSIDAVVTVGAGFGSWRRMSTPRLRAFVWGMWYLYVPAATRVFGFVPAKVLGLGEDLPAGVAGDWARWGKRDDYFSEELADTPGFSDLKVPWKALLMADDPIANRASANALLDLYTGPDIEVETIVPAEEGLDSIGHLHFFSRKKRGLWSRASDYLVDHVEASVRRRRGRLSAV